MLPSIEGNLSELDQLYNIINTMYEKVIPSINDDLTTMEALVTSFEKSHSREQQNAMNVFLNYLSSSTDSNDDKRGSNHLSSITLHDKDEFLKIIKESKYIYTSNEDNVDSDSNDDSDDNDKNINNNEENDDEDDSKSQTINVALGLAMPITLGDSLRQKTKSKMNPV